MKAQVGDNVKRMLISVKKTAEANNAALFNMDVNLLRELAKRDKLEPNMLVDKKTFRTSKIHEQGGLYTYPIWIKRRNKGVNEVSSDPSWTEEKNDSDDHDPF